MAKSITSKIDPMDLVLRQGSNVSIKTDIKAFFSIKNYIERTGSTEGKKLAEHFSNAPFGWF